MKHKKFSLIFLAAFVALCSVALASCDNKDDDPDSPDNPSSPNPTPVTESIIGVWEGYYDHEKMGECLLTVTLDPDKKGNFVWRDARDGTVLEKENFNWSATQKELKLFFTEDGEVTDTEVYEINRVDNEVALLVYDECELFAFIRKSAQKKITNEMLLGSWLVDYQWSESRQMWRYDEATFKSGGNGHYIENAYRLQFGGSVDEFDFTWKLSGNDLTLIMPNGEFGYKPYEPEYEEMTVRVAIACNSMMWLKEDDEYFIALRK